MEIAQFDSLPVKPGMGFSDDKVDAIGAHLDIIAGSADSRGKECIHSSDVSGWDWSVLEEELDFDSERRIIAGGIPAKSEHARAMRNRSVCLARSVVSFSDGLMVAQTKPGVMKSGSYRTSSGNSWIRYALARFAGATEVAVMGDDCVDDGSDSAVFNSVGHPLKENCVVDEHHPSWIENIALWPGQLDAETSEVLRVLSWEPFDISLKPSAEFCSHFWCRTEQGWLVVFGGWRKSLFRLLCQKRDKLQHMHEFAGLMAHSPAMPYCVSELRRRGWFDDTPFV
jgi:hypothetical protein